jgi:hypothetical protein
MEPGRLCPRDGASHPWGTTARTQVHRAVGSIRALVRRGGADDDRSPYLSHGVPHLVLCGCLRHYVLESREVLRPGDSHVSAF